MYWFLVASWLGTFVLMFVPCVRESLRVERIVRAHNQNFHDVFVYVLRKCWCHGMEPVWIYCQGSCGMFRMFTNRAAVKRSRLNLSVLAGMCSANPSGFDMKVTPRALRCGEGLYLPGLFWCCLRRRAGRGLTPVCFVRFAGLAFGRCRGTRCNRSVSGSTCRSTMGGTLAFGT
jgi:hypothetical protein